MPESTKNLAQLCIERQIDWLASVLETSAIQVRRGTDPLPAVRTIPEGHEVAFPVIDVVLRAA